MIDEQDIEHLLSSDVDKIKSIIDEFNTKNATLFDFTEFNISGQWLTIWNAFFTNLRDPQKSVIYPQLLNSVRILTRDEQCIKINNIQADFSCLLDLAGLGPEKLTNSCSHSTETSIEALKCLCNIIFLSSDCRKLCIKNSATERILKRVSSPTSHPFEIEYYDMKLLFLITALEPITRTRVQIDLNGVFFLTEWIDMKLSLEEKSDEQIDLICEILKVMFNITSNPDRSPNENEIQNRRLTAVIRGLLYEFGGMQTEKHRNVISNCVNLLTNISTSCLYELITKPTPDESPEFVFENKCIRSLEILLRFLKTILDQKESNALANDSLAPVLTVLINCARCCPVMRHYIRQVVLPPLKDVSSRPEVGDELRNHLCRFLTIPEMIIRDLSAELLFVCCKENVSRMIKYTGYGNAAGLFASRGVLDCRRIENTEYSSDSEDSDTEEYKQMQHGINPVLGCFEKPKPSPLAGMSEEQKEFEAMQLVSLMDKLNRSGVVQPCRVGEDGKPHPVDHILQLQEELPQQQFDQKRKT